MNGIELIFSGFILEIFINNINYQALIRHISFVCCFTLNDLVYTLANVSSVTRSLVIFDYFFKNIYMNKKYENLSLYILIEYEIFFNMISNLLRYVM